MRTLAIASAAISLTACAATVHHSVSVVGTGRKLELEIVPDAEPASVSASSPP